MEHKVCCRRLRHHPINLSWAEVARGFLVVFFIGGHYDRPHWPETERPTQTGWPKDGNAKWGLKSAQERLTLSYWTLPQSVSLLLPSPPFLTHNTFRETAENICVLVILLNGKLLCFTETRWRQADRLCEDEEVNRQDVACVNWRGVESYRYFLESWQQRKETERAGLRRVKRRGETIDSYIVLKPN